MSGAAAGGAMAGILIANNVKRLQQGLLAAATSWASLTKRGLVLVADSPIRAVQASVVPQRLDGKVEGIECSVRVRADLVYFTTTEIVAIRPDPVASSVGVHPSPAGVLGKVRQWIGQDVDIGDPPFDAAFLVTSKPREAARDLLAPSLREAITALGGSFAGFSSETDRVVVLLNGVETDPVALEVALDLAVAAAKAREAKA